MSSQSDSQNLLEPHYSKSDSDLESLSSLPVTTSSTPSLVNLESRMENEPPRTNPVKVDEPAFRPLPTTIPILLPTVVHLRGNKGGEVSPSRAPWQPRRGRPKVNQNCQQAQAPKALIKSWGMVNSPSHTGFDVDVWSNWITEDILRNLRAAYNIPDSIILSSLIEGGIFNSPPSGFVSLSTEFFSCRLRLPLQHFFHKLMVALDLNPGPLTLNTYSDRQCFSSLARASVWRYHLGGVLVSLHDKIRCKELCRLVLRLYLQSKRLSGHDLANSNLASGWKSCYS